MEAGSLNRKIEIYTITQASDGRGGKLPPVKVLYWATDANIKNLTASRTLEANQVALTAVTIFTLRFRNDKAVAKDMQIKELHSGQWYTIQSVQQYADGRTWLEIRGLVKS